MSLSKPKQTPSPKKTITLKKNFVDKFTITINLPDTCIDVLTPLMVDTMFNDYLNKKDIMISYVLCRELGDNPPKSAHYHLWCRSPVAIRRDYFRNDYLKPLIRSVGFSDKRCTSSKGKYIAVKCNKVKRCQNDYKYTLGYVLKEGNILINCLQRVGYTPEHFQIAKDYYFENRKHKVIYQPQYHDDMRISETYCKSFLKNYPTGDNLAEKCINAVNSGYELMCLKLSTRMHTHCTKKDKLYIYNLFTIPYTPELSDYFWSLHK